MPSGSIKVKIAGMHCASCEILIGEELKKLQCIKSLTVNHKKAEATIRWEGSRPTNKAIEAAVKCAGYEIGEAAKLPWLSRNWNDYRDLIKAGAILLLLYGTAKWFNLFDLSVDASSGGFLVALVVGLVAGISTCMALIGGLVLSLAARHAEAHPEATPMQKFRPHLYFNLGRIAGYTLLGGFIGLIGSAFRPSPNVLGFMTMVVGGVMIFLGLKLVEIFPVLKNKSITLPSSLARLFGLKTEVKEYSHKTAAVMGALTFFLPCGFTQAMQIYALSTGSFITGALTMGLFALGTSVGLLSVGGLTSIFKGKKARLMFMAAGLAVIILGWTNLANGSRLLSGGVLSSVQAAGAPSGEVQIVNMTQSGNGYSPNEFTVEANRSVKWIINATTQFSCSASLVVPKLGISKVLTIGENIIEFTPTEVGEIPFSCSMGMYRGKFVVVGKGAATSPASPTVKTANAGGGCGGGGGGGCGCGGGARRAPQPTTIGTAETQIADSGSNQDVQVIKSVYTYNTDIVPNTFTVKKGVPIRYEVEVKEDGQGCMSSFTIPRLTDQIFRLTASQNIVMAFTPTTVGDYPITCAMGVPRGVIKVID